MSCSQGLTCTGYVSKPPLLEIRTVNCVRGQVEKKRKDEAKATRLRKRLRKEAHEKENKRRVREGLSRQTTPESTLEASSSSEDTSRSPRTSRQR